MRALGWFSAWGGTILLLLAVAGCGGAATALPAGPTSTIGGVPSPPSTPAVATPGPVGTPIDNAAVRAAVADLARQRGVAASRVVVVTVEAVEWPDAGLGCPQPGRVYAQVLTPGFRVQLRLDAETIIYHTNQSGAVVTRCPRT